MLNPPMDSVFHSETPLLAASSISGGYWLGGNKLAAVLQSSNLLMAPYSLLVVDRQSSDSLRVGGAHKVRIAKT